MATTANVARRCIGDDSNNTSGYWPSMGANMRLDVRRVSSVFG